MEEGTAYRRGSKHDLGTSHFSTSLLVNRTDEISLKNVFEVKKS
jgi:hypothetical protein